MERENRRERGGGGIMRETETEERENRSKKERSNGYKGERSSCSYL